MKIYLKEFKSGARMPEKAHASDFCYDVFAASEEEIAPNVWKYSIGWGMQIDNQEAINYINSGCVLDIDIRPRSSIYKTGLILANCTASIDMGYTGEIQLIFYHVLPNMPRYKVGDKIGQMKIGSTIQNLEFVKVDELNNTDRGEGGFGSTGN